MKKGRKKMKRKKKRKVHGGCPAPYCVNANYLLAKHLLEKIANWSITLVSLDFMIMINCIT